MQLKQSANRKQMINLLCIEHMIDQYLNFGQSKPKISYKHKHDRSSTYLDLPIQPKNNKNKNHSLYKLKQPQFFKQSSREIVKNSSTIDASNFEVANFRAVSLQNIGKRSSTRNTYNAQVRSKANEILSQRHKIPVVKNKSDRLFLRGNNQETKDTIYQDKQGKLDQLDNGLAQGQHQYCIKTEQQRQQSKKKQRDNVKDCSKTKSVFQRKQKGYSYQHFKIEVRKNRIIKNRYELMNVIGRGMSGSVYKAKDILANRFIAIKVIQPNAKQYEFMKQISHKNIVEYYNNFIENGKRYLVLEYFPMTLATLVKSKRLTKTQIRDIFCQVVDGVLYLHGMSIAHRDIKLDNIVITEDLKTVKFIDFGLCSDINDTNILTTQTSDEKEEKERETNNKKMCKQFCGTPNYMAPQIISNKIYDPKRSDIWSLGVLLYAMAVGRYPFQGSNQSDTFNKIKNKKVVFPETFQQRLKKLITRMLTKDPQNRPSILDVLQDKWLKQQ